MKESRPGPGEKEGFESPPLRWTDWPAERQPGRSFLAAGVIFVSVAAVLLVDPFLALLAALLLVGATSESLLPSHYHLDASGVRIGRALWSRQLTWPQLEGWTPAPDGFLLHGAGSHAVLRRRRTVRLQCPAQREAVAAVLQRYLA